MSQRLRSEERSHGLEPVSGDPAALSLPWRGFRGTQNGLADIRLQRPVRYGKFHVAPANWSRKYKKSSRKALMSLERDDRIKR
jgi:hypothetical protein